MTRKATRPTSYLLWLITLACGALIARNLLSGPLDFDIFWHLAQGRDLFERGWLPHRDHYSFTFPGAPIRSPSLLYDALLYLPAKLLGGLAGTLVVHSVLNLVPLFVLARLYDARRLPLPFAALALALCAAALSIRTAPRPEHGSFVLSALMITLIVRARERWQGARDKPPLRELALLNLLLVGWVNYHVSSVIGYALIGSLYLDRLIRVPGRAKEVFAWGALSLGLGFLNLSLDHPMLFALQMPREWFSLIQEYAKVPIAQQPWSWVLYWPLAAAAAAWFAHKRRWLPLILLVVLGAQALSMAKFTPFFIFNTLPFLALEALPLRLKRFEKPAAAAAGLLLAIQLAAALKLGPVHREFPRAQYPVAVAEHLRAHGFKGDVLTWYGAGSYFTWSPGPDARVYIDGRTNILYPVAHHLRAVKLETDAQALVEEMSRYQLDYLVAPISPSRSPLLDTAIGSGLFEIAFQNGGYALLRRGATGLRALSKLYSNPLCWRALSPEALARERLQAEKTLPASSQLRTIAALTAATPESFKAGLLFSLNAEPDDRALRLAAHLSQQNGLSEPALRYLDLIAEHRSADWVMRIEALLDLRRDAEAEATAAKLVSTVGLSITDARALERLLGRLKSRRAITRISGPALHAVSELARRPTAEPSCR